MWFFVINCVIIKSDSVGIKIVWYFDFMLLVVSGKIICLNVVKLDVFKLCDVWINVGLIFLIVLKIGNIINGIKI